MEPTRGLAPSVFGSLGAFIAIRQVNHQQLERFGRSFRGGKQANRRLLKRPRKIMEEFGMQKRRSFRLRHDGGLVVDAPLLDLPILIEA